MTQSAVKFATLGELRARLQSRIGGVAGLSFGNTALDSYLQEAQKFLYELVEWKHLRASVEYDVAAGHVLYDLPDDVNLEKINGVWIYDQNLWRAMGEGISVAMRNYPSGERTRWYEIQWVNSAPDANWKLQLEVFPVPTEATKLRYEYFRSLLPFENADHFATLPDSAIFLHALYHAKLHYRQPDAPAYEKQLDQVLTQLKGKHRRKVVFGNESAEHDTTYDYPPSWPQG